MASSATKSSSARRFLRPNTLNVPSAMPLKALKIDRRAGDSMSTFRMLEMGLASAQSLVITGVSHRRGAELGIVTLN